MSLHRTPRRSALVFCGEFVARGTRGEAARLGLATLALCGPRRLLRLGATPLLRRETACRAIVGRGAYNGDESVVPLLVANRNGYRRFAELIPRPTSGAKRRKVACAGRNWPELHRPAPLPATKRARCQRGGGAPERWRGCGVAAAPAIFDRERLGVEIQRHFGPRRGARKPDRIGAGDPPTVCRVVATNGALYAKPGWPRSARIFSPASQPHAPGRRRHAAFA